MGILQNALQAGINAQAAAPASTAPAAPRGQFLSYSPLNLTINGQPANNLSTPETSPAAAATANAVAARGWGGTGSILEGVKQNVRNSLQGFVNQNQTFEPKRNATMGMPTNAYDWVKGLNAMGEYDPASHGDTKTPWTRTVQTFGSGTYKPDARGTHNFVTDPKGYGFYSFYGDGQDLTRMTGNWDTLYQGKDPALYPNLDGVSWDQTSIPYYDKTTNRVPIVQQVGPDGKAYAYFANPELLGQGPLKTPGQVENDALWAEMNKPGMFDQSMRDSLGKFQNWALGNGEWTAADQANLDARIAASPNPEGLSYLWNAYKGTTGYADPTMNGAQVSWVNAGDDYTRIANLYGTDIANALAGQGFIDPGDVKLFTDKTNPNLDTTNEDTPPIDLSSILTDLMTSGLLGGSMFGSSGSNNSDLMGLLLGALQGRDSNSQIQPLVRPTNEQPAMTNTKFY